MHEVCLQIMTVGSEVQEIRGWGKQPGDLRQERCQGPAEGAEQVPSAQCWGCQERSGPHRPLVQYGFCCLHPAQLCSPRDGTGDITRRYAGTSGSCLGMVGEGKGHSQDAQQAG